MRLKKPKKLYDIIFLESRHTDNRVRDITAENYTPDENYTMARESTVEKHTTDKNEIRDIINKRIQNSLKTKLYTIRSIHIQSHDLKIIKNKTFVSQETENLGAYTVLYPNDEIDPRLYAYAPDKNIIDLNLNFIQKAQQR